ncbi:MAG: gliding motility-associated C-terminal domain-containing protein [Bacteroidetes bacterium]|nr:gliding motility-associated C-terminal domain-containing protein [Bacteroidota bacterium]
MRIFFYILFSCIVSVSSASNFHWPSAAASDTAKHFASLPTISSVSCPPTATPDTLICTIGVNTLTLIITGTNLKCNGDCSGTATVSVSGGVLPYTYQWTPSNQTTPTATGFCAGTKSVEVWDNTGISSCIISIDLCEPQALFVSINPPAQNPSCFSFCDGSATASPTGGTPPYTYLWSDPFAQTTAQATGLCNGTYSVTVTDANLCTKVKTVTLTQPFPLNPNGSSTPITCFGQCNGTASVNPSGGTSPYTYSWMPGGSTTSAISNLCAGNYTCTITDSHTCVTSYVAAITQPPALTITVSGTNLLCNAVCTGSVTATVSGGVPPYTYSWSPGGCTTSACTGLCANNYTLTLTDANGCTKTATVAITQPTALSVSPTGTNVNCFGLCTGTANANASGGIAPYTYSWTSGCTASSCTGLCAGSYTVTVTDNNGCTKTGTITITQPTQLTVTPTETDVTCNGLCNGSVTATASGGTPAYTYSWSNGCTASTCTGLCAGTYSITVTDSKGCTAASSITVNSPAALVPNLSSTGVLCFGQCNGSVSSSPTGGTSPYTYSWMPGGCTSSSCSGLCAGTYTLTLTDANGCPASATIAVTQPSAFTASISSATPNPLNCNGDCNGTAVSSVSGGTAPYTYLWSTTATTPSITGLCAGVYTLQVTDANGCMASASVTFLQPTTLTVTITSSNPKCNGDCSGSISAVVGGGTPAYTFNWNPGGQTTSSIAGQCAGTYTLIVTDSKGCTNTQTITLTDPPALAANASVVNNVLCSGQCNGSATSSPTGGTAPYTYLWTGGQTTSTATGLCAGTFSVTVTDSKGCSDIGIITITQPLILSSSISSTTSSCTLCNGTATVSTSGGTMPYTFLWCNGQTTSTAVGLCPGTCTVTVTDANGCKNTLPAIIKPVVTLSVTVSGNSVSCFGACDGIATATPFGGGSPYTYAWSPTIPVQTTQSATGLCAGNYTVNVSDSNGCIATNTVTFTNPPALTITMSSTTASCGICNGTATASPSGGTGGYTYTWSPGFPAQTTATATGLCAGNYTVTVADTNNCTLTNTVSIGNIPNISDNPSVTLATCGASDGAICISPSGGTPAYTYVWSPGGATTACITGLAAGIDTVMISDAAGCKDTFAIAVGNISGPTVTVTSSVDPTCNGSCDGSASVSVAGTNPPFTYSWAPSGCTASACSGLCAGNYIVTVTDNISCVSFAYDTLNNPPALAANPTITNVSCNGGNNGNICLSPSGGTAPYTYIWLPIGSTTSCVSGLTAGIDTVVLADSKGCSDSTFIPVTEPSVLTVTISSTNVTCNGNCDGTATASASGGTPLYSYLWSTGAPIAPIVGLCPGVYTVTVTDGNGCTATATVSITEPAVLTTTISSTNVSCNGNCDGTATINASGGTTPYTYSWNSGCSTSACTGLCPGNYVVTVTDADGCASSQSVAITEPALLSATVTFTNASCSAGCDGTASATVSGGTAPYTYLWNPTALTTSSVTGLCVGSYTLNISDANGCSIDSFLTISSPALLQPNITTTAPLCSGSCDGTATSTPIGGISPYTFLWSNAQTTSTATGLCAGTYSLTLSDANGCSITQAVGVTAPPILTQSNGVAPATCNVCNGSISVIASGGTPPYSFFWSTGATTATITGLCAGVYIDTVMDANGCISIDTIPLNNTSGPTICVTGTNISCNGACDGTVIVSCATGDGPPWGYSWFPGGCTTQTCTGLCPNQYFATVTDTNGCQTISSVNITEPAPLASNSSITSATCFGVCNGSITLNPSGGTPPYTYSWSNSATTSSITALCAGNYTDTLRDANNCTLIETFTVGQNAVLTSSVTSTNDSCNASCNGTAMVTISGGTSPYTYLWCNAQTTSAVTGLCAGICTVTVTDALGCFKNDSAIITQPAPLAANVTGTNPLCNGSCNGTISSSPTGGTPPYTYVWSTGCTVSACTGLCAGTYTLTLTDTNLCSSTSTVTLTDPPVLASTHTVTNASCPNTCDGIITITPAGGTPPYTYQWFPAGCTSASCTGLCAGLDSVIITDANNCSITDTMNIGVTTTVTAAAGIDVTICEGDSISLCSGSVNATSQAWYQLPAWTLVGTTNCVNVSPPASVNNFALIAMNGICADTDTVNVTVIPVPLLLSTNDTTICQGDSVSLCASGATTYQWFTLPAWTPVSTGICYTVSPSTGTTCYGIIGTNGGMCVDSDTVCVTVLAMPVALAGNDTAFCFGGNAMLCSSSLNTANYSWYQLPAWTIIKSDTCIAVSPPVGINDFGLIASNGICSDTDTVSVTVFALPVIDAGTDVTILTSQSAVLNGTGTGTYSWSPSSGLSCTTCINPTANPTTSTTYTLTVTDANGCTSTDTVRVNVVLSVVPNDGLSPNGDGINDVWIIPGIEQFPEAVVEVYNRWGELLFSSVGYKIPWDAKYNGKDLPVGTYYYVINLNSDLYPDPVTGPITILR